MDKRVIYYSAVSTLEMLGWGLYLTFIVRYVSVTLGGGSSSLLVFLGSNWGFTLFSILIGGFLRVLGEKKTLLLGTLCSLPPLVILFTENPYVIAFVSSVSAFPWGIMWSIVLKDVFAGSERTAGVRYSVFTAGRGVGFFLGSILTGLIYSVGGVEGVVVAMSIVLLASSLGYYVLYHEGGSTSGKRASDLSYVVSKLWIFYTSLVFVVFARELFYSIAPPKLDSDINMLVQGLPEWAAYSVFGLVYSGGAVISPLARYIAGKLVDKHGPRQVYVSTALAYIAVYWVFVKTTGLIPLLVWQIPLFPFLDTGMNVYIAKRLNHDQIPLGIAAGLSFTAFGGLMVILMLIPGELSYELGGIAISAACLTAVILALMDRSYSEDKG
ncbi:MAG: hypothetical protein QW081_04785 [Desulfurococcaceae archaeon]